MKLIISIVWVVVFDYDLNLYKCNNVIFIIFKKKSNENIIVINVCMIELFFMMDMGIIVNYDNKIKNIWLNVIYFEYL